MPPRPAAGEQVALLQPPGAATTSDAPRTVPTAPSAQSDGKVFQDCPECPSLVRIAEGAFTMGAGAHDPETTPAHNVTIRAFAIGQFPITLAEWKACVDAGGCDFTPHVATTDDRTPVHNLSWDDTQQYIGWLSRKTGHRYRLPSEAEWEYAARGGATTRYWWGNEPGIALANCADCGGPQEKRVPMSVDAFKANAFGLYDVLGGVAQWVEDCWYPNYQGAPANGAAREAKTCLKRVLRGGSFRAGHDDIAVTARANYDSSVRYVVNGFRVARDLN